MTFLLSPVFFYFKKEESESGDTSITDVSAEVKGHMPAPHPAVNLELTGSPTMPLVDRGVDRVMVPT